MDLSKKNPFSAEEAKNCTPRTEKRKKVTAVCEILSSLGLCPPPCFQFYHRN